MSQIANIYWVQIDVSLKQAFFLNDPKSNCNSETEVQGGILEIGITEYSEYLAKQSIYKFIKSHPSFHDLKYAISFDYFGVIEYSSLEEEVYNDKDINDNLLQSPEKCGIWYRTGVGWYT